MAGYVEFDSIEKFEMFDGTFESIKDNLFMRLFNKNNLPLNRKLSTVPHIVYADLAITFSVEEKTYIGKSKAINSYLITNKDMKALGVNKNILQEIAVKNLLDKNSVRVESVSEHVLRSHIFSPLTRVPNNTPAMLQIEGPSKNTENIFEGSQFGAIPIFSGSEDTKDVLLISNRTQTFAPINLIMPEVLDKVYDEFKENFYIVPSSIHELICIRQGYATNEGTKSEKHAIEDLEDMVEQINDVLHKNTSNILSYNIYYHMYDDKRTMIIT